MSFVEQERVLFELLFDAELRDRFCKDPTLALAEYDLDGDEQADFMQLRPDALRVDAGIRTSLVLAQLCRSFPITFGIISSIKGGLDALKALVDVNTMRSPNVERATVFGNRLGEKINLITFSSAREQQLAVAIFQLELGMAWTGSRLKRYVLETGRQPADTPEPAGDWIDRPVRMAEFVTAGIIPQSYDKLKKRLCPVTENELWRHLARSPTASSKVTTILAKDDPRLLVSRAQIEHMSLCEPVVAHLTTELSEGFAPLFQHINGTVSINSLLAQLKQAGATDQILESVKSGFFQLIKSGMLVTN